jgi:hypothetical protein
MKNKMLLSAIYAENELSAHYAQNGEDNKNAIKNHANYIYQLNN